MINSINSDIRPLQKFMTEPQQKYMELHEECNNFMCNLLSIKEFSVKLKKPESTIRTWIRRGDIPKKIIKKIGSTIFIIEERFNEWVEKDD